MTATAFAAQAFVDALVKLDFAGLESTLQPNVAFRALVPGELVNVSTAAETAQTFRRWLGDKTGLELLHLKSEMLVDRLLVEYRLRLLKKGQPYFVEQRLSTLVEGDKFAAIDLICSGFQPEGVVETAPSVHRFDAGDLGCGSGLPREFRSRLVQIPVGHILETITTDPSAKEDLPSLARMLGHKLLSIDSGAEGKIIIRVERAQ